MCIDRGCLRLDLIALVQPGQEFLGAGERFALVVVPASDRYQHGGIDFVAYYLQKFAAYYYNRGQEWQKGVAINYKNKTFTQGSAVLDIERGQLKEIRPF